MIKGLIAALAAASLVPLAACKKVEGGSEAATQSGEADISSKTLAAAVSSTPGMSTVASALKDTGLASVFDGSAPYTLLAPDDDAFGKLGDAGRALKTPEQLAVMAAILREHVVPGFLTTADIQAAITANKGQPVKMRTVGEGSLSFALKGDDITVTSPDGTTARLAGAPLRASNGVAIPVDSVLKKLPAT